MANTGGIISLLLSGVTGLAENLFGEDMEKTANEKERALGEAPKFDIPDSQIAFEENMRKRVGQGMPGAQQMKQDINATTSAGINASARASGSQFAGLGGANYSLEKRRGRLRELSAAGAQYQSQAEGQYAEAVKSRAPYETAQFEYNQWLPWQINKNEIASLRGAGQQELMSGLDRGAAAGINAANMMSQNQYYNKQNQQYI